MNIVEELRQKIYLEKLYKRSVIDLDNYFKYSGKVEKSINLKKLTPKYRLKKL
tara:strand:+ start:306 stop:464 length:159 start_codon:yes stop_codon:yes gene_type:complete